MLLHRVVVDGLDDDRVRPHVRLVGILERRFARVREGIEIPGGIGEDSGMCVRRLSVEADPEFHGVPKERVINAKDEAFMMAAPFAARKTRPGATAAAPLCVCRL